MARTVGRLPLLSKENTLVGTPVLEAKGALKRAKISAIREHWEKKGKNDLNHSLTVNRTIDSPTLKQIKSQPGKSESKQRTIVSAVQRELEKKHHAAKSKVEGVGGLGGGVSLWPAMDDMRLSKEDTKWLAGVCLILVAATVAVFLTCHSKYHLSVSSTFLCSCTVYIRSHILHAVFKEAEQCMQQYTC